jgi:conjugal transfer pilus assembly protein TraD
MEIKDKKPDTLRINIYYIRNYGLIALCIGIILLWRVGNSLLDKPLVVATACIIIAWACYELSRYIWFVNEIKGLDLPNSFKITRNQLDELRKRNAEAEKNPLATFIGKGFVWDNIIAENYFAITRTPEVSRMITSDSPTAGQYLIHNIGRKNDAFRFLNMTEHTAVLGTTGVGKSSLLTLMATQRIMDGEAVIILDPKGDRDTLNTVYRVCCDMGRAESFRFFSLAHLRKSHTYNPFASKLRSSDIAARIKNILGTPDGANDVFLNFCWSVVNVAADLLLAMDRPVTLHSLFKSIFIRPENLKSEAEAAIEKLLAGHAEKNSRREAFDRRRAQDPAFQEIATPEDIPEPEVIQNLRSSLEVYEANLIAHDKTHMSKMIAGLKPMLTLLSTKEIGGFLSAARPSIQWEDVVHNKRVVYFFLGSMLDEMAASALGKLILQDLLAWIGTQYAYKENHSPVSLFGDEFYNLIFPGIADLLSKSRGAGFRATFFMQTQAEIAVKTKIALAAQIFGNINNVICMRVPEYELAEMISLSSGEIFYPKRIVTRGTSATLGTIDQMFKDSQSERMDREAGSLIPPTVLTRLAVGNAFVMTRGLPVYKTVIPLLDASSMQHHGNFFHMINEEITVELGGVSRAEKTYALEEAEPRDFPARLNVMMNEESRFERINKQETDLFQSTSDSRPAGDSTPEDGSRADRPLPAESGSGDGEGPNRKANPDENEEDSNAAEL